MLLSSFPTTLALASPHTTGKLVEEAQTLLKTNRWNASYFTGTIDGDFGPLTGAACHRAKYWLGYPDKKCVEVFGAELYSYLVGKSVSSYKDLPLSYKVRRTVRLKTQKPDTLGQKAITLAKTYEGYREQPTNRTIFGQWYGLDANPWCAMFVSYCLAQYGSHFKESYVPTIVAMAQANNQCFVTNEPEEGDLVCFDWDNNGEFDHVGFFDSWIDQTAGTFNTVEGNTLPPGGEGSQSNGGGVYARQRGTKDGYRVVFVRVKT